MEQKCSFKNSFFYKNGFDGPSQLVYFCAISKDQPLTNENDTVIINTDDNNKTNEDILAIGYISGNQIKYIPQALFTTFVNVKEFFMDADSQFETLKPEYLNNANNLKVFGIWSNEITKLGANLFVYAPNLEHINFQGNKIERIDRLTFSNLTQLQGLYLPNNKIANLHPETFSHLKDLQVLNLLGNVCVNKFFGNANTRFKEIEEEIRKSCTYTLSAEELAYIERQEAAAKLSAQLKSTTSAPSNQTEEVPTLLIEPSIKNQQENEKRIAELIELNKNLTMTIEKLIKSTEKKELQEVDDHKPLTKLEPKLDLDQITKALLNIEKMLKESDKRALEKSIETNEKFEEQTQRLKELEVKLSYKITEEAQKVADVCEKSILQFEYKSSNNYLMIMKSIQDQKTAIDLNFKVCKNRIVGMQNKILKAGDNQL